ncbi:12615_t:CDS:1 [Gigaspora margarita]|uniref:12615_t:CDS:1 n=1 Tax=Gigaspora margarita TaxID=4874 RepID=A0ABN7URU7_GIGMA|nr:12615_t:CDS:1 [Gigaspora margarita]
MTTVITRTVASFFSNDAAIISKKIAKKGININLTNYPKVQNIVLAIIEKENINKFDKEVYKFKKTDYDYSQIIKLDENKEKDKKIVELKSPENKITDLEGCKCKNCLSSDTIDIEKGIEKDPYVYAVSITKMGLLDYIVYYHRMTYD